MARKNPAAVALGRLGGRALAKDRGPDYFAALQAKRTTNAGGRPSVYDPLTEFLQNQPMNRIKRTLYQIADMGIDLPMAAKENPDWWGNEVRSSASRQCRAWLKAGWTVKPHLSGLDPYVVFTRQRVLPS